MMTKYKLTPSLLNSFLYMQSIKDKEKREAEELRMVGTLQRDRMPSNPAMDKGNEFESLIEQVTKGVDIDALKVEHLSELPRDNLNTIITSIAAIVQGGEWQKKVTKDLPLNDEGDVCVVTGKIDVEKPSIIYDIKYSGRKRLNKFSGSTQHRIYMYCTGIERFSYLISDGKDWWREDYYKSSSDYLFLMQIIREFKDWLGTNEAAAEAFQRNWIAS